MIWSIFCNFDIHLGSNFLDLVSLENYQMGRAICNDGTPAVYYRNPLNGASDSKKLLIFLQGGGMCVPNLQGKARHTCVADPNVYFQDTSGTNYRTEGGQGFYFHGHYIVNAILDDLIQNTWITEAEEVGRIIPKGPIFINN